MENFSLDNNSEYLWLLKNNTEFHDDSYFLVVLGEFLKWFTLIILFSGILLGLHGGLYIYIHRTQLLFKPHLVGITCGNLVFLLLIGLNLMLPWVPAEMLTTPFCKLSLYLVGVSREFPYLCMVAVAVEQFSAIYRNPYHHVTRVQSRKQTATVLSLLLVCFFGNSWALIASRKSESSNCLVILQEHGDYLKGLMIACLAVLDVLPILFMLFCHAGLIWKLRRSHSAERQLPRSYAGAEVTPIILCNRVALRRTKTIVLRQSKRRQTIMQLLMMVSVVSCMNLPKILQNILDDVEMAMTETKLIFSTVAYVLYHLHYVVDGLYIQLPLFRQRKQAPSPLPRSSV